MRPEQNRGMDQEYYHLTEEQVRLVRNLHFGWADGSEIGYDGAPCVGSKRPFGNSHVPGDVWEIVDPRPWEEIMKAYENSEEDEEAFADEQQAAYDKYYRTLAHALQVIVSSGSFEPGIYSCNKYCSNYKLVTDEREIFKAKLLLRDKHAIEEDGHFSRY